MLPFTGSRKFARLSQVAVRTIILAAGLFAGVFFSRPVLADTVVASDFAFQLDHSVFDAPEFQFVKLLQGDESFQLPDFVFNDEAPVHIKGISASVHYKMNSGSSKVFIGAEHVIASDELSVKLNVGEVSVDAIVEKRIGGVIVRAKVQGKCSGISIELPQGQARLVGSIATLVDPASGLPSVSVPWFELNWPSDAWVVNDFSCVGLEGFKGRVSLGLKNYLKNSSTVTAQLRKYLDERVAGYQAQIRSWFLQARPVAINVEGLKVTLKPKRMGAQLGDKFQIFGVLEFAFQQPLNREIQVRGGAIPQTLSPFTLWVPESLLGVLNAVAYQSGLYSVHKSGKEIQAFEDLRKSSFQRSWVWPELGRFDDSAVFLFDIAPSAPPTLSALTAGSDGLLSGNLIGDLRVKSWAPKKGGYEGFVNFSTPVNADFKLQFAKTAQGSELKMLFSKFQMNLQAAWDLEYKDHLSNDFIRTETLESSIEESMEKIRREFPDQFHVTHQHALTFGALGFKIRPVARHSIQIIQFKY